MTLIKTNVVGKVRNIPLSQEKGIMALHEAIVNSLHAIDDAKTDAGEVLIEVRRDFQVAPFAEGLSPIRDIVVKDNGIGFNNRNYKSFREAESTYKLKRGGKGVGRFLWLKVFDRAEVRSVFRNTDQKFYRRDFAFVLDNRAPLADERTVPLSVNGETHPTGTTVKLCQLQEEYAERLSLPLGELADLIIEHHLNFLVDESCPQLVLREQKADGSTEEYDLNYRFRHEFLIETDADSFTLHNYPFELAFLKVKSGSTKPRHAILYCADKRVVTSEALAAIIPNLNQPLQHENGEGFDFFTLVSGSYLNQHVNRERTKLDIPSKPVTSQVLGKPLLSLAEIQEATVQQVNRQLDGYLTEVRREKQQYLQHYVNTQAPQYRTLLKYPHLIDRIKPGLSDDKLDIELYKARTELVLESKIELNNIVAAQPDALPGSEAYTANFTHLLSKITDTGQASLVDYVLHRKMILRLFESVLTRDSEGNYALEKQIHKIVFPMQNTSDEVDYEDHNLWLIDERLAYHRFLQSDKPLNEGDKSSPRPDILLSFDKALLYTDARTAPYDAFTIIEFKRPMRKEYTDESDPVRQVLGYIDDIRAGDARTEDGRPIIPTKSCKFYCYIICDLTKNIHKQARLATLTLTPDEAGYFGFNPNYNAYIEIISFDKLVGDSKQRNQILFDKLGIAQT